MTAAQQEAIVRAARLMRFAAGDLAEAGVSLRDTSAVFVGGLVAALEQRGVAPTAAEPAISAVVRVACRPPAGQEG